MLGHESPSANRRTTFDTYSFTKCFCPIWPRARICARVCSHDSRGYGFSCSPTIPQLEKSLRLILANDGSNTAKLNIDLTQEDQSLSQLYSNQRKALEAKLGVDITYILHLLFNLKGGPMIRHEMAHGKLSASDCYNPSCVYACWLMYHITCLPLLSRWNSHVAPAILELRH